MKNPQEQVEDFHRAFNIPSLQHPTLVKSRLELRRQLIAEEHAEWIEASQADNLADMAKELADLLYVIYGTFAELGLDSEAIFAEVHRSNMTKVWTTGDLQTLPDDMAGMTSVVGDDGVTVYREDGKVLKPPSYSPADLGWINRKANMPRA